MTGRSVILTRWLLMPLLVVSLLAPGGGGVLCVGSDGRASLEPAGALGGCAPERCDERQAVPWSLADGGADCVDLLLSGLVKIRSDRSGSSLGADAPGGSMQPTIWSAGLGVEPVTVSRAPGWRALPSGARAPDADRLQTFILLI